MTDRTPEQLAALAAASDAYKAEYYRHGQNIETGVGWVCKCGWKPKAGTVNDWLSSRMHVSAARRKARATHDQATSEALR